MKNTIRCIVVLAISCVLSMANTARAIAESTTSPFVEAANGERIPTTQVEALLNRLMQEHSVPGVSLAIVRGGEIVYSQARGLQHLDRNDPVTDETLFETASISKAVFAVLVMHFVEQGRLDLDKPLWDYLELNELSADPRARQITARMVLSHSSGLPNWRFHNEDGALDIKHEPGTQFLYSGEGYEYLAKVLVKLTGGNFEALDRVYQNVIARPARMTNSGFLLTEKMKALKAYAHEGGRPAADLNIGFDTYFGAAYSLHANALSFAGFINALADNKLIDERSFQLMATAQIALPADESLRTEYGFENWGLGLLLAETPFGTKIAHGGMNPGFQGYFMLFPKLRFGFVYFGNSDTAINMLPELESCFVDGDC